jgi:hypothetical protein
MNTNTAIECTEHTERTELTELTDANRSKQKLISQKIKNSTNAQDALLSAIYYAVPTEARHKFNFLWILARSLKTYEQHFPALSKAALKRCHKMWHNLAVPWLPQGQTIDTSWGWFTVAWENALFPLDFEPAKAAFELAHKRQPPAVSMQYETQEVRWLVTMCCEMQRFVIGQPFFLSCRTVAKLFGRAKGVRGAAKMAMVRPRFRGGLVD